MSKITHFETTMTILNAYIPGASGGFAPLVPPQGLCPGPTRGLKRPLGTPANISGILVFSHSHP